MARFRYDRSSKWLIDHHGDMVLRLGGVRDVVSWRSLQAEVVQPRQLPDGLLEVRRQGQDRPDLFVVELTTYPEWRVAEQVLDDVMLVYQDRRVVPEVLVVVLQPRGNVVVANHLELDSHVGWTRLSARWRVVAEELLQAQDPGLVPWVPLTHFEGPPESLLQRCRAIIDARAKPEEHDNLLAVTQVLAGLRFGDSQLLAIIGGRAAMIESPVLQNLLAEKCHDLILGVLEKRFGPVPTEVASSLKAIRDNDRLYELNMVAAVCPDLEAFRREISP
jgi:hypothetical protein